METLLRVNPLSNRHYYSAGGSGKPIITRPGFASTKGIQTFGLPSADKPMPGGGANKTTLGAYRMGDQDGNANASAMYPGDIFSPLKDPLRKYPAVLFQATGFNVYQPTTGEAPTNALLQKMAERAEKAKDNEPYADYFAVEKLSREVQSASRNASLSDLQQGRQILRHAVAMRREQNMSDYLRRMVEAGMSPQDAQDEIDNITRVNALQEAKKVEDRDYQAKMLISNIAKSRGLRSVVNAPLTTSGAISSAQPNAMMSAMMGEPGKGFGESPLDVNRIAMTPAFYKTMLRKTEMTEESAQEHQAMSTLLAQGEGMNQDIADMAKEYAKDSYPLTGGNATSSAISANTFDVRQKQENIEARKDSILARLENVRMRSQRVRVPLPAIVFAKECLKKLYGVSEPGKPTMTTPELIETLHAAQLLMSINLSLVSSGGRSGDVLRTLIRDNNHLIGPENQPKESIIQALRKIALHMNGDIINQRLPLASRNYPITGLQISKELHAFLNTSSEEVRAEVESAHRQFKQHLKDFQLEESQLDTKPFESVAETQVNNPVDVAQQSMLAPTGGRKSRQVPTRTLILGGQIVRTPVGQLEEEARQGLGGTAVMGRTAVSAPVGDDGGVVSVKVPPLQKVDFSRTSQNERQPNVRQSPLDQDLERKHPGALPTLSRSQPGITDLRTSQDALSDAFLRHGRSLGAVQHQLKRVSQARQRSEEREERGQRERSASPPPMVRAGGGGGGGGGRMRSMSPVGRKPALVARGHPAKTASKQDWEVWASKNGKTIYSTRKEMIEKYWTPQKK